MISSELRIGNYYDQFGNIHQVDWVIIKELSNAPESQIWCKPIPLTEEWLNKIEWQLVGRNTYHINSYFSLDKYGHVYYQNDYTGLNIYYVHQLQNLIFSLTGQELKVLI